MLSAATARGNPENYVIGRCPASLAVPGNYCSGWLSSVAIRTRLATELASIFSITLAR